MSFGAVLLLGAKTKSALLLLQRQTDDRFQKRPATTLAAARISVTKTDRYESRIAAFRCCARTGAGVWCVSAPSRSSLRARRTLHIYPLTLCACIKRAARPWFDCLTLRQHLAQF